MTKNIEDKQGKFEELTKTPISKLILKMAIPSTMAMLIGIAYSLADTYFISKIDTISTASVGLAFSFMSVTQAFGLLYGHGSGNYMSRMESEKNRTESSKMAIDGLVISFLTGIIIMIFGELYLNELALFLGATNSLLSSTKEYLLILLIGTPFMISALTMNNQFRLQGNPSLGAAAITSGAVINCILDPIFIFYFNLGIKGAAYATVIGEIISFIILIVVSGMRENIKFNLKNFSINKKILSELYGGGIPNFTREIFIGISLMLLNNELKIFGEEYIASFTIVNRLVLAGTYLMVGLGHGFQPVCIFNYGAKLYERVEKALKFTLRSAIIFMVFISIIFLMYSENMVMLFRNDNEIINIGSQVLSIQSITLPLIGYITITGMFLQSTHKFKEATLITSSRQGYIYIPLILIMPKMLGVKGILYVQPLSDFITFVISVVLVAKYKKELKC
ncbi:MATE family efflux transporter [Clostridium botulinum]|uniref:MATE family efflux transporter n=1 Tax=Clostridium botulinum TaxID=1491 RepID=UPI000A1730A4|nr:MATE family efflux transporter [Clostridium botulinum]AUN22474.1 MATE family efflux transporter [Clostridium botulinum]AUN26185.1 MATE family efflux transporter [Clostridium botulinum]NFM47205.1 MATE family efflux transporter [Clostridium botulinum]OSA80279.1 MATE family efflux transporter [Clostridium botulinum]QDY21995.1 MATE family efflux transporter [Clostridium botulinum]